MVLEFSRGRPIMSARIQLWGMRELEFVLEWEPGHNRVAEALAKYPETEVRSLSLHATSDSRDFQRLADASAPAETASEHDGLAPEQAEALETAVEHSYYETPREIDVAEPADVLDVPRATLNHRLRRAEEQLAK